MILSRFALSSCGFFCAVPLLRCAPLVCVWTCCVCVFVRRHDERERRCRERVQAKGTGKFRLQQADSCLSCWQKLKTCVPGHSTKNITSVTSFAVMCQTDHSTKYITMCHEFCRGPPISFGNRSKLRTAGGGHFFFFFFFSGSSSFARVTPPFLCGSYSFICFVLF